MGIAGRIMRNVSSMMPMVITSRSAKGTRPSVGQPPTEDPFLLPRSSNVAWPSAIRIRA